ncbi:tRNA lysidine(34) synthetase TilS [Intestinirhabdus alba]|uniref:tRNA(Ile)-lysidine synthase n=1 Tax=Intestinirhabdus alba TaxID=2899544 RepID=A0A6L6IJF1_9ENTR|nr:tRNA lysidine(34) synthetase TilS [Intestinirhabdus alba]MTH45200.1 tRNA lysidine(34) synthetase TilS [Intestinirhabdus alba]
MTTLTLNTSLLTSHQILVAFSGGLDSTVLLHQLTRWRDRHPDVRLRAIHIHHGLSPHAEEWVRHCEAICQAWQVPLQVERVTLVNEGLGVEAHARRARYQAFARALRPGELLATAQHLDDQCETFLLALKRGSGPAGLSAMAESAPFSGTRLIRPLLSQTRQALGRWAEAYALRWIEDESNQDDAWDRNFLRLRVLPLLQQRWPHFADAAARSAALCAEQESLLDELLAKDLADCMTIQGSLRLAPLMVLSDPRRAAILRRWLASLNAPMPSRDALGRLWQEVALAREDASPCLRVGEHEIRRYREQLWWVKSVSGQTETVLPWQHLEAPLPLPEGLGYVQLLPGGGLRPPRPDEAVSVRFKAPGVLHIVGRGGGGRKLKKIWQELGVPPWERDTTPLLFYGETPIAAAGRFITAEGAAVGEGVRLAWKKDGR